MRCSKNIIDLVKDADVKSDATAEPAAEGMSLQLSVGDFRARCELI